MSGMANVYRPHDLRAALTEFLHTNWSFWMEYLFSNGTHQPDGSFVIPAHLVTRWQKQRVVRYENLPAEDLHFRHVDADRLMALLRTPALCPELQQLVTTVEKTSTPFDLDHELRVLRAKSDVVTVTQEHRTWLMVTRLAETTIHAKVLSSEEDKIGALMLFDRVHVSEHDESFVREGAKFWEVTASETDTYGRRQRCSRLIFVPPSKA